MIYVVTNDEGKIRPISRAFTADNAAAPVGAITPGFVENDKWKYCEGQSLSVKEYPALFSIIGYTYGGEGDHFNLPDMREYVPVGAGKRASNTSEEMILGRCYESQFGSHTHAQAAHCHSRPAHTHTSASHNHSSGISHRHSYCCPYCWSCIGSRCWLCGQCYCSVVCASSSCVYMATTPTPSVSSTWCGSSSSNADSLNAATATNCATGCADGITRGRRYGLKYIIRVA